MILAPIDTATPASPLPAGQILTAPTAVPPAAKPEAGNPPATPMTSPIIDFSSDRSTIKSGECTKLRWNTANIREVYLDGTGVTGVGSQKVCPSSSQKYTLMVRLQDGSRTTREVKIKVK